MINLRTGWFIPLSLLIVSVADGADFEQTYYRESDEKILLQIGFDGGVVVKNSREPWDKKSTDSGVTYFECSYKAKNREGKVVNQQKLWYFPREPVNGNTDASNYWVYWHNPGTEVTWGRCPTPHHPHHGEWLGQKGADLWQIVPKDDRPALKRVGNLKTIGQAMDPTIIGSADRAMPKVAPETGDDTIFCVDFENTIFI